MPRKSGADYICSTEVRQALRSSIFFAGLFSCLLQRTVEINEAVAVVNGQGEEIQERQAEESRDFCSEVAALVPHVKCGHPEVFLPETGELKIQIAGLVDIRHLAVDAVDPGASIQVDLADLSGHFIGDKGLG